MKDIATAVRRITKHAHGLRDITPGLGVVESTGMVAEWLAPSRRAEARAKLCALLDTIGELDAEDAAERDERVAAHG